MTYALWIGQALLSLVFLAAGGMHAFRYEQAKQSLPWVSSTPRPLVRVIGVFELLGAAGVILPAATGVLPWLTPLAAAGLGLVMILAVAFHFTRREVGQALPLSALLVLAAFVAIGRQMIVPL